MNNNRIYDNRNFPFADLTQKIIECAIEVHRQLGPGFLENIYENALIAELKNNGLKVESQKNIPLYYKDTLVGEHRLDLLVEDKIIVENKTVKEFNDVHKAQLISYLKAAGKKVGLLLNFAKTKLEIKRIIV